MRDSQVIDQTHPMEAHWEGPVFVNCDLGLTKQAIRILVDNAIKYTPNGGAITMTVEEKEGMAHLSVTDEGIGISPGGPSPYLRPVLPGGRVPHPADRGIGSGPVHRQMDCGAPRRLVRRGVPAERGHQDDHCAAYCAHARRSGWERGGGDKSFGDSIGGTDDMKRGWKILIAGCAVLVVGLAALFASGGPGRLAGASDGEYDLSGMIQVGFFRH